jgi:hypothetical protein
MRGVHRDYSQMEAAAVIHVPAAVCSRTNRKHQSARRPSTETTTNERNNQHAERNASRFDAARTDERESQGSPNGANAMSDAEWQALARICAD